MASSWFFLIQQFLVFHVRDSHFSCVRCFISEVNFKLFYKILLFYVSFRAWGSVVVKALRY